MRSSLRLIAGVSLSSFTLACTGPERNAFPEDPATSTSTTGTAATTGSSPTSSGSTASTSSSSDGGADPNGPGGNGPGPSAGGGGDGGAGGNQGDGGATTGEGGGGGPPLPTCDGGVCLPALPGGGWTGPVALFEVESGSLPTCNLTGYPTTLGDYFGDLDEGTAVCACDCNPATGIVCTGNASYCGRSGFGTCDSICSTTELIPELCYVAVSPNYLSVFAPEPDAVGSCSPSPTVELPTPTWGVKARACQGATTTPDGCDVGETCAPEPHNGEICVVQSGDSDCPAVGWTEKHLRHVRFDDTRACSACSCGSATSTCGGQITFTNHGVEDCGDNSLQVDSVNAGACSALDDAEFMQYTYGASGTCPPSGGALGGEVTLDGTATYCCVP